MNLAVPTAVCVQYKCPRSSWQSSARESNPSAESISSNACSTSYFGRNASAGKQRSQDAKLGSVW